MSSSLEQIKKEISALPARERFDLWRNLSAEFDPPLTVKDEEEKSVEASWDEEIENRVREVEEGKVELISGEESDRRIKALFAAHGVKLDDSST